VVGVIERGEALGVLGRFEDLSGVVDIDQLVARGVEREQRLAEVGDGGSQELFADVVEEQAADAKGPPADLHGGFPGFAGGIKRRGIEDAGEVARVERGGDGGDRSGVGNVRGRDEHCGATEAVVDEDARGLIVVTEEGGARMRSSTLEEKVVLANSPPLDPSPVKPNRSTAMPS
jgi:hypothetical protein